MDQIFLAAAVFGGAFLVLQLAVSLLGLGFGGGGGDGHLHLDVGPAHDAGGVALDHAGDVHTHDFGAGDHHDAPLSAQHGHVPAGHHQWAATILKYLTLQTITAFLAFFGVGGLAMREAGHGTGQACTVGLLAGVASMFLLGSLLQNVRKLHSDGALQIQRMVGCPARVYLRIPGGGTGVGKVTVHVQGRTVEITAKTTGPDLPTGANVVVQRIIDKKTVEVAANPS